MGRDLYPDLISKAAVLFYSLAKSQACTIGNKRIAAILLQVFLRMNGHLLSTTDKELERAVSRVGASDAGERLAVTAELKDWLNRFVVDEGEQ